MENQKTKYYQTIVKDPLLITLLKCHLLEIVFFLLGVVDFSLIELYTTIHSFAAGIFAGSILIALWKEIYIKQERLIDGRAIPAAYALILSNVPDDFNTSDFITQSLVDKEKDSLNSCGQIDKGFECSGIYKSYKLAGKYFTNHKKKIIAEYEKKNTSSSLFNL